ncbi:hypothetical protein D9615_004842 [Tricholomella constricta]|uniref:COP9 signalosome complex subunit 3 N-terminal helical repeats domain-containing protein n=1 Tax=Tricholomella constricta TaxID=117010 RepID=A0A8H5HH48_9AGAR|nr:hypothetical protein D9615_004842 [Tricholomella constricta]
MLSSKAIFIALTTLAVSIFANPIPAPSTGCAAVHIITARGSSEPPGEGTIGAIVDDVVSSSKQTVSREAVVYPATVINYLGPLGSQAQGVAAMKARLAAKASACPDTKIVLTGYSQGAHVAGDVLASKAGGTANVAALILMGDPGHVRGESFQKGTANMSNGLFPRSNNALEPFASKINSFCDFGDPFCAASPLPFLPSHPTQPTQPNPPNHPTQTMAPQPAPESLDSILTQITTSNSPGALNHTLRNALPKESRDTILASALASGQDPLSVLDVRENTLGVLYILAARLNTPSAGTPPPPWPLIQAFCRSFIPEQARLAPDRVTALAKGIASLAASMSNPKAAVQPLSDLVQRYPPDASYLTALHPIFALTCVKTHTFPALLPVLSTPITSIDLTLAPDLTYGDNLSYHYLGGVALAALKSWRAAEEFFEIAVSAPGVVPAALQLEALKKLRIVQLIAGGKVNPLPKYTHPLLGRLLKNSPYNAFINAYPNNVGVLADIMQREAQLFATEKNTGLLQQAVARAPRWALKKLTATYVTLGLGDIGRAVGIEAEEDVRALLLSMIEAGDIAAQMSADGTVTFSDPAPRFTKAQVDAVLADVQGQAAALGELEREMGRSKEFLGKVRTYAVLGWADPDLEFDFAFGEQAVKSREEGAWIGQTEEEVFSMSAAGMQWAEDAVFT